MKYLFYIVIVILLVIVPLIVFAIEVRRARKQPTLPLVMESFSYKDIYPKSKFKKIVSESNKARKNNSPFIPDLPIHETLEQGARIIEKQGAFFIEAGNCDERPIW